MKRALHGCLLVLLCFLGACVRQYEPPTLAQPHAVLKIRRTYDTLTGTLLSERMLVDDHLAVSQTVPVSMARAARIDAVLVHPVPATFVMDNNMYHQEYRQVQDAYYEQEMYWYTESYDCSLGSSSPRTCSRQATGYRPVTRYRWVTRLVDILDAQCRARSRFTPAPNRVYLLQYNFQEHAACSLSCFEQVPVGDGTFKNRTCPPAPPAED